MCIGYHQSYRCAYDTSMISFFILGMYGIIIYIRYVFDIIIYIRYIVYIIVYIILSIKWSVYDIADMWCVYDIIVYMICIWYHRIWCASKIKSRHPISDILMIFFLGLQLLSFILKFCFNVLSFSMVYHVIKQYLTWQHWLVCFLRILIHFNSCSLNIFAKIKLMIQN